MCVCVGGVTIQIEAWQDVPIKAPGAGLWHTREVTISPAQNPAIHSSPGT